LERTFFDRENPQFPAFRQLIQTLRQFIQNPDQKVSMRG
jgi:hypothetical protein